MISKSKKLICPQCESNEIVYFIDDVTNEEVYYCESCSYTAEKKEFEQ